MRIEEPLLSRLSPLRFKRILDVGCGYGRVTSYLKIIWPDAEVIALDISRKSTLYVKRTINVDCLRADGLELPLRDEAFDLVTCTQVIEHVKRGLQPMFVAELGRVLRRGGYLYITSVLSKAPLPLSREHVGEFHSVDEFKRVLQGGGLRVVELMLRLVKFPVRHTVYRLLARLRVVREDPSLIEAMKGPLDYCLSLPRPGYFSIDALATKPYEEASMYSGTWNYAS
jgi:SAM-dependent methyltransferase